MFAELKTNPELQVDKVLFNKIISAEQAYVVLLNQLRHVDEGYTKMVVENPLIQLLRTGPVYKRSDGMYNSWEQRFLMLTNCGILYFKKGND